MNIPHTTGPWSVIHREDGSHEIVAGNNIGSVAVTTVPPLGQLARNANANLIAAAPDLLAALQALVERGTDSPEHIAAERAIAKATGA